LKTFEEICEQLKGTDEITLLEVLNISSEEIVERFQDLIELKLIFFQKDLEEEEDNDFNP
jgi:hypothetical protein